jgi:hypothetical protein
MNALETVIEQRLSEAQYRRGQVLQLLNAAPDARRSLVAPPLAGGIGDAGLGASGAPSVAPSVAEADRALMTAYRAPALRAPPPLCDVPALRIDDLLTAFLRWRRSLHHLCYQGSGRAAVQVSELAVLQQRIERVRWECFVMLEQLRAGVADAPLDTTRPADALVEGADVSGLRADIAHERARLKEALARLTLANFVRVP